MKRLLSFFHCDFSWNVHRPCHVILSTLSYFPLSLFLISSIPHSLSLLPRPPFCPPPPVLLLPSSFSSYPPPPVFLLLLLAGSRPRRDVWVHEQLPGDCEGHRQRGILVRHTHEIGLMLSVVCHMMLCQETAIIALSVSLLLAALKQLIHIALLYPILTRPSCHLIQ